MKIDVNLLWPTIIPYELWVDMLVHSEFYVSNVRPEAPEWRGWHQIGDHIPDGGWGDPDKILTVFRATFFFSLASWRPCDIDEEVPADEQAVLAGDNPFRLVRRSSLLLLNNFSQFLLWFRFQLEPKAGSDLTESECSAFATDAIIEINHQRKIFENLRQTHWRDRIQQMAEGEVRRLIRSVRPSAKGKLVQEVGFIEGGQFPLTLTDIGHLKDLYPVFSSQETISQVEQQPSLVSGVEGAFAHFGWSYAVVSGIPYERAMRFVPLMAYLQFSFFLLRYFRHYAVESMERVGATKTRKELEANGLRFDRLSFHFQRFVLDSERFHSAQHPFWSEAINANAALWRLPHGVEAVEKSLNTQRQFLERRFSRVEEKVIKRQAFYLDVIALMQLPALFGIVDGAFQLHERHPLWTYGISALCGIALLFGLGILLRPDRVK